jgi:hypothetical protein
MTSVKQSKSGGIPGPQRARCEKPSMSANSDHAPAIVYRSECPYEPSDKGLPEMVMMHQMICRPFSRLHGFVLIVPILASLALAAGPAQAQNAPGQPLRPGLLEELGLWWGMSFEDVLSLNEFTLEYMGKGDGGDHYAGTAFPPVLGEVEQIILFFGFDDRLWRLALLSPTEDDGSGVGTALFARYDEWKATLDGMYGMGRTQHRNTSTDIPNPREILGSLAKGTAWHFTEYRHGQQLVQLGVKGTAWRNGHTAVYIKHVQMGDKVQADLEEVRQNTGQIEPVAPTTDTERVGQ